MPLPFNQESNQKEAKQRRRIGSASNIYILPYETFKYQETERAETR